MMQIYSRIVSALDGTVATFELLYEDFSFLTLEEEKCPRFST